MPDVLKVQPYPGYARGTRATADRCQGCRALIGHGAQAVQDTQGWWHRICRENLAAAPLDELQREVTRWAQNTFGEGSTDAILTHLTDEVMELIKADLIQAPPHGMEEEAADVLILLLQVAKRHGFSLYLAALDKFEVNKRRQWGPPDERGVIRHVEEGTP